jgi:hypothetical protein
MMDDEINKLLGMPPRERPSSKKALKDMPEPSYLDDLAFMYKYNLVPRVNYLAAQLFGPGPSYSDPLPGRERSPVGFMGDMPTQATPSQPMALNAFVFNPTRAYPRYYTATATSNEGVEGPSKFMDGFGYLGNDVPAGFMDMATGRYPGFVR